MLTGQHTAAHAQSGILIQTYQNNVDVCMQAEVQGERFSNITILKRTVHDVMFWQRFSVLSDFQISLVLCKRPKCLQLIVYINISQIFCTLVYASYSFCPLAICAYHLTIKGWMYVLESRDTKNSPNSTTSAIYQSLFWDYLGFIYVQQKWTEMYGPSLYTLNSSDRGCLFWGRNLIHKTISIYSGKL